MRPSVLLAAVGVLALAAARTALADANCSLVFGCTECVELDPSTLPPPGSHPRWGGGRRLAGRGGNGGGPGGPGGRPGGQGGGQGGGHEGGFPDGFKPVQCTACDPNLDLVLRNFSWGDGPVRSKCVCKDGYGAVVDNSTLPANRSGDWHHHFRPLNFTCVKCEGDTVPLTPAANLSLVYDNATSTWKLVLGSNNSSWFGGGHGHHGGGHGHGDDRAASAAAAAGLFKAKGQGGKNKGSKDKGQGGKDKGQGGKDKGQGGKDKGQGGGKGQGQGGKDERPGDWPSTPPPYRPGQCVPCPEGSSTSNNVVCVADA